jgi:transaldolase/glucose-6-phosphate isomerase
MATLIVEKKNPLRAVAQLGQSIWLDYIRRTLITSGELQRLADDDDLRGVTSNPSIFEKAIAGSKDYDELLAKLNRQKLSPSQKFEQIAVRDIRDACDLLRPVYARTKGRDGFVSIEVSPLLALDTQGTIAEARRLWGEIDRPNVMIKVPGTPEGVPAFQALISEGINVNVTLLFAQSAYIKVAEAYIAGLEKRAAAGQDISKVASVASFFVSRIDTVIDKQLEDKAKAASSPEEVSRVRALQGKVAIANAKQTYRKYQQIFSGPRWEALAAKGARTQRVLWASTGTKNPKYPDTLYLDSLIGPDTVNTVPPATLDAFRDHGTAAVTLTQDVAGADATMEALAKAGVSMERATTDLLVDGVRLFRESFEQLIAAIEKNSVQTVSKIQDMHYSLPDADRKAVEETLDDWEKNNKVARLWKMDPSLWTNKDESKWMGWLSVTTGQIAHLKPLLDLQDEIKREGFTHALLLGMGGSSLCPEVMAMTFGQQPGYPELHILDATDPYQVKSVEQAIDLKKTIFIVASKSGSTLEPNIFKQYFFSRAADAVQEKSKDVGSRFIAITDPGSKMQQVAEADKFRHIFFGLPSIGGRYSALSNFGMVPAAVAGIDIKRFLESTEEMVQACGPTIAAHENPGVLLGAIMGTLAKRGRDKITFFASPGIFDIGAWLEQLIAESTGKNGKGIIPVDRESLADPALYGSDRLFVYLRLASAPDAQQDEKFAALEQAGLPVVRIEVKQAYDIGQEYFRWEIATAVAGSVIGINPFDQPDVEAAKIVTRQLTTEYEKNGSLPEETARFEDDGIQLFTDDTNWKGIAGGKKLEDVLRTFLSRLTPGDYFALLGYVPMNAQDEAVLQRIRHRVRDNTKNATCLGFGPRYLHSTGQAYKGGPNTGVFLQITCDHQEDIKVPGQQYTFGVVEAAQARGDFSVLVERKRRALRVHLAELESGLQKLDAAVTAALRK